MFCTTVYPAVEIKKKSDWVTQHILNSHSLEKQEVFEYRTLDEVLTPFYGWLDSSEG